MIKLNLDIFPAGADAYIVGGSIRDLMLDRIPTDYDIAVGGSAAEFAAGVAAKTGGHMVEIGKAGRNIIRVVSAQHTIDIAPVSGPGIADDLAKRDFTINAMACHLSSGKIIDPLDGQKDLLRKKIRMISADVFGADPIRLLRAYRLAASLGFEIEPQTVAAICDRHALIRQSAGERIRAELFLLFERACSHPYLIQMSESGLLTAIFPEMIPLMGCRQNRHHDLDAFEHSLAVHRQLEDLIDDFRAAQADAVLLPDHTAGLLKIAALLHDIGKPPARTVAAEGAVHFYGHAEKSATMTGDICARLRFSRYETQFLDFIIRNHLRPLSLFTAQQKNSLSPRGLARFFLQCGDDVPYLLLHTLADNRAKRQAQSKADLEAFINDLLSRYLAEFKPEKAKPPLISGDDLIREFNLKPSPRFKKILSLAAEAQMSKAVNTREEALKLVADILAGKETH